MATSESDDFESADEELTHETSAQRNTRSKQWTSPAAIDSESDDDTEFVPRTPCTKSTFIEKPRRFSSGKAAATPADKTPAEETSARKDDNELRNTNESKKKAHVTEESGLNVKKDETQSSEGELDNTREKTDAALEAGVKNLPVDKPKLSSERHSRGRTQQSQPKKSDGTHQLGAKKLGTRIVQSNDSNNDSEKIEEKTVPLEPRKSVTEESSCNILTDEEDNAFSNILSEASTEGNKSAMSLKDELVETEMPEELLSNKKFKDIFKPQGWEDLGHDIDLPEELAEDKLQPVLEKLSLAGEESQNSSVSWGGWGSWGVSSLINTATAGVSTLTSHVSHGLTLLEESINVPDPSEISTEKQDAEITDKGNTPEVSQENQQSFSGFGFGNFISGVSSITKLVESTGSKVMSGGLDTLEAIGKKTMEVLQDGDPGLKKKRAFFLNEEDKPNLSQVLREAKEKAETAEKSVEEREKARRVHFESLFDDYQGLVHLEALEMLSKQSNLRIQQLLADIDGDELMSMQETLEEVKELCEQIDDEENTNDEDAKNFNAKLQDACADLGVNISYVEKLSTIWEESQAYVARPINHTNEEIFEYAISTLAQFTAFSIERLHKTAELLLVKKKRSVINEADAFVQLINVLSNQVGVLANCFCDILSELAETSENSKNINTQITTIFMEAANASTYIQDVIRLLVPIIQVGVI